MELQISYSHVFVGILSKTLIMLSATPVLFLLLFQNVKMSAPIQICDVAGDDDGDLIDFINEAEKQAKSSQIQWINALLARCVP